MVAASYSVTLNNSAIAYLNELAVDIAQHGPSGDMDADLRAAHERRQAFALEMANGSTPRAQKVREVLAASIYGQIIARDAIRSTFLRFDESERRAFVLNGGDF